jgi:hypothetical protein
MKKVRVILSQDAEEVYKHLVSESVNSKLEKAILQSIQKKVELIKLNFHYGEPIAKQKIPSKFNVTNLFWVELANHWRLLYTLTNNDSDVEIIAFVLHISDHKTYDKVMKYK